MKKLLALILALIMAVAFTSCGDDRTFDDIGGNIDGGSVSSEEDTLVELGGVDGTVYKNASVGIQVVAPEGWIFYSDAEIAELNQNNTDLEASNSMIDMMIIETTSGNNVSVSFENLGKIYGSVIGVDKYLELSKTNLTSDAEFMANVVGDITTTTITIAGETWGCLKFSQTSGGMQFSQICAVKKCGKYMALVTATGLTKTPEELLTMVTAIQ